MARANARAVVPVEVFVKQRQIAPMRIALKLFRAAVNRSAPVFAAQEDTRESTRNLIRYFPQIHEPAGAGWAFDFEIIAQVVMKLLQRLDQQEVDREPDRAAPIRVAAEQPRTRFSRLVINAMCHPIDPEDVWVFVMVT